MLIYPRCRRILFILAVLSLIERLDGKPASERDGWGGEQVGNDRSKVIAAFEQQLTSVAELRWGLERVVALAEAIHATAITLADVETYDLPYADAEPDFIRSGS